MTVAISVVALCQLVRTMLDVRDRRAKGQLRVKRKPAEKRVMRVTERP